MKFKKDLSNFILNNYNFDGDILEVGTNKGYTTVILAYVADILGKKVYSYDISQENINFANNLMKKFNIDNVNIIKKDVYKEKWDLDNIGFVFVDCVHERNYFVQDVKNSFDIIKGKNNKIVCHDYGLMQKDGDSIKKVISDNNYKILCYLGEKDNWNKNGTGRVIDWEGVVLGFS
mgnify:CR=1 FL=1